MPEIAEAPRVPSTARHYAQAVFDLAREEGSFEPWQRRLLRLRQLLEDSPLGQAVRSPGYSLAQRGEIARAVVAQDRELDQQAANLLYLLIQSRRTAMLAAVEAGFRELVDRSEGRVKARLSTAVPVTGQDLLGFGSELSSRLGVEVSFEAEVDPSLLGGAVVRVGDRVFDASLRTRLQQLRQQMLTEVQSS